MASFPAKIAYVVLRVVAMIRGGRDVHVHAAVVGHFHALAGARLDCWNSRNPHQFVGLASHFNAAFEAAIDHGGLYKWDKRRERTVVFVFERCVERIQEPAEKFRCIAPLLHGELFVAAARHFV